MPFADKNGLAAKRMVLKFCPVCARNFPTRMDAMVCKNCRCVKKRREARNDGWVWLWKSVQGWLRKERKSPDRRINRLTHEQVRLRRYIYNQTFYAKHKPRLLLSVRETRRMCDDVRERWNGARRIKRKGEKVEL